MSRELLAMALDALDDPSTFRKTFNARAALRAALAAPEPLTSDQEKALLAEAKTGPFQHATPSYGNDTQSGETPRLSSNRHAGSTPPAAPAPAAPVVPDLKHCACEFDGDTCVTQCKLHAAHVDAIHEWAERAKAAEAKLSAAPVVPLTDEQIRSMWKSSEFRGNGGQADWFCEGIRAAEAHHGITGASK